MKGSWMVVAAVAFAGCGGAGGGSAGGSGGGSGGFVLQSIFVGSCVTSNGTQCVSQRQNSDPMVDVRTTFQAACSPGVYSAGACGGTWAGGCCLVLTPNDMAGYATKFLLCDKTALPADFKTACDVMGGTVYASVPQF